MSVQKPHALLVQVDGPFVIGYRLVPHHTDQVMFNGTVVVPAELFVTFPYVHKGLLDNILRSFLIVGQASGDTDQAVIIQVIENRNRLVGKGQQQVSESFFVESA